jgi:SAM-dependent methyltransferase
MRMKFAPDGLAERVGLRMNLVPLPGAYAMFGMTAGRVVGAAQRLGLFSRLLDGPAGTDQLAADLGLRPDGVRLLCATLTGAGLLRERDGRLELARSVRKWIDPASSTYIGTWLEHTASYWEWYGDLERVVREGGSFEIHRAPDHDEDYWRVYITGQYELARLSAAEVARAIRLPRDAAALLDVAGGHGWFAAGLCERHPALHATVVDLPGSARVGREIIARAGLADRVHHVDGDMFSADLGGPYDGALAFDIIHHLSADQTLALLQRIRAVLRPGATIAILDMFRRPGARQTASAASLGLFFHLTSGADLPDPARLAEHLHEAGFGAPRRTRIRRIPDQDLYQAVALG